MLAKIASQVSNGSSYTKEHSGSTVGLFQNPVHVADLGHGGLWALHPGSRFDPVEDSWMNEVAAQASLISGSGENHIRSALRKFQDADAAGRADVVIPGGNTGKTIRVLRPEASAALGYCRWDGDGQYDLSKYKDVKMLPTLGQIVTYVRMMQEKPKDSTLTIHLTSDSCCAQGAILAGARLVLAAGKGSAEAFDQLTDDMPKRKDWDRFPSPFETDDSVGTSSVTVQDCLAGLQVARDFGWLDYTTFDIRVWQLLRVKFDASWLIPGEMMALGDPAISAQNPKYPNLLERPRSRADSAKSSNTTSTMASTTCCTSPSSSPTDAGDSDDPVQDKLSSSNSEFQLLEDNGLVEVFEHYSISRMIRLNFLWECKQTEICPLIFRETGMRVIQREFTDGNIPKMDLLRSFLDDCTDCADSPIAVHCKGGMGRTGVMIGAYANWQHGIDGKAFHGWARLCRPGSVQTVIQERFLRTLRFQKSKRLSGCLGVFSM